MTFTLPVFFEGRQYKMEIDETYAGATISRFRCSFAGKTIGLNYLPSRKGLRRWQISCLNWRPKSKKTLKAFVHCLVVNLHEELYSKPRPVNHRLEDKRSTLVERDTIL